MIHASSLLTLVIALVLLGGLAGPATAQGTPTGTESVPANLTPPASAVLLFELGARGAQVYACEADPDDATAFAWTFKAPDAELLNGRGEVVGHHFDGPTWQGLDGSAVAAAVAERADAPDSTAIPWLLLEAPEHAGSGAFATITHIPRLDTVGGVAPTDGCDETHAGEEARVPYEATYAFYYPAASATPAAQAGLVTIHVFSCPADLSQATGEGQPDRAALLAGCTPLASAETAPTLLALPDGEPSDGTMTAPGVYQWDGLALGDYAIGGSGEMPAELGSLLVTDAGGAALQNPVLRLNQMTPHAESFYFYFLAEATPSA